MEYIAKVVRRGNEQIVELPEDCSFIDSEVPVRREGERIVLGPATMVSDEQGPNTPVSPPA